MNLIGKCRFYQQILKNNRMLFIPEKFLAGKKKCIQLMPKWNLTIQFTRTLQSISHCQISLGHTPTRNMTKDTGIQQKSLATVGELLSEWTEILSTHDIFEPAVSVEYIIAHVLGKQTLCGTKDNKQLSQQQVEAIKTLCHKRLSSMPVQYILGEWSFRDLTLKMQSPVLIPRPETEELVDLVMGCLDDVEERKVLEVGCGSGAIVLSLLHEMNKVACVAVDQSLAACELTRENARLLSLGEKLTVKHWELNDDTLEEAEFGGKFDVIVSNPPYIPSVDMAALQTEVCRFEDPQALDGGRDGTDLIVLIIRLASKLLKPQGVLWLEVDSSHPPLIQQFVKENEALNMRYQETHQDFCNKPRFCSLKLVPG